jgi:hypothetical protein
VCVLFVGLYVRSILGLGFADEIKCRFPEVPITGLLLLGCVCCEVAEICRFVRGRELDGFVEGSGVPAELLSDGRRVTLTVSSFGKKAEKGDGPDL